MGNTDVGKRVTDRLKSAEERLLMIVNPKSRKGSEKASGVRSMARREGICLEETSTDHPDDVGQTIEFWSKRFGGSRVSLVMGGDGALNQVVNNIMLSRSNKNVIISPIPAGTANDFCRAMKIKSTEASLDAIADSNVKTLDLIRIDFLDAPEERRPRWCTNIVGFGLDADLARRSQKYTRFGVPGYWYASLKYGVRLAMGKMPLYRMKVRSSGLEFDGKLVAILISKIDQYGRSFKVAPGAKLDDGKLYVTLMSEAGLAKTLLGTGLLLFGKHGSLKSISRFECTELELEIWDDAYSQENGDVFLYPSGTKLRISVEPQAINVFAPESSLNGVKRKASPRSIMKNLPESFSIKLPSKYPVNVMKSLPMLHRKGNSSNNGQVVTGDNPAGGDKKTSQGDTQETR